MTTDVAHDQAESAQPRCWCCGSGKSDDELVRLGNHPEVGICPRCARWLHRRATQLDDERHPSIAARACASVRAVRNTVINRGWHRRRLLGALLRRIDRYLP